MFSLQDSRDFDAKGSNLFSSRDLMPGAEPQFCRLRLLGCGPSIPDDVLCLMMDDRVFVDHFACCIKGRIEIQV